jgi:enoyl-[acyl-carrier protein] reductase/trans-2-enoyl-CoA reductase (NAD+)
VAVMKGVMTQAASAIPGMSVYLSLLFKVMKAKGTHEGCIEQTTRLFKNMFVDTDLQMDKEGRLRLDDWELADDVQAFVKENWSKVSVDNLMEISDFAGYRQAFLQMHGFDFDGVDYDAEVEPDVPMALVYGAL